MAQSSSTAIKDFVKHALTSYYKNFQIKLADNATSTDTNPAIKINNGKIFVYNVGGYTGQPGYDTNDSSTIQEVINSATNNINDINSEIIDINEKIASIPGTSKMIAGNNDLTIQIGEDGSTYFYVEGYRYNKDTSSFAEGYEKNTANGNYSHAEGKHTKAINNAEHAEGQYNQSHSGKTIHSIGIGTSDSTRKNAFEVMQDGSIYVYGLGNYNGSALTNASTLQDICNLKANKVVNATIDNFVSLGVNGNLQDSGKKAEDFALVGHSHSAIMDANTESNISIDEGVITITIEGEGSGVETRIEADNIGNFNRALATPSSTPENDATKLITSKAVYDALAEKMSTTPVDILIHRSNSSYPLQGVEESEQALDSFIGHYPKGKHFICSICIENDTHEGYATGVAYWEFKSSEDEIYVYVRIGVKEFVAQGQSQEGEGVGAWALSWVLNDYSQDFFY